MKPSLLKFPPINSMEESGRYFDGSGNPHYYVTDWQGNNIGVVDRNGLLEQRTDYYPYGEPWIEPEATMSGQGSVVIRPGEGTQDIEATAASSSGSDTSVNVFLFGDKERTRSGGLNEYRFPARDYVPGFPRFATIDPMCEGTPWLSPYAYCAGNPVMYIDPSGAEVRGASRADAKKIVEDLHEIFRAETFEKFRSLITNKGARIAKISEYDLAAAFEGVQLSEDQQALVDIVVNTINSKDKHVVEYLKSDGNMSSKAADAFSSEFEKLGISMTATAAHYGGIPSFIIAPLGAEGLTTPTSNGTYSVLYDNKELYLLGRSVTTGHELFGHGRSLANGRNATQNIDAIQTENLILRVMGIDFIRDGIDHGLNIKSPTTLIPSFR